MLPLLKMKLNMPVPSSVSVSALTTLQPRPAPRGCTSHWECNPLHIPSTGVAPLSNFPPQAGDLLAGSCPLRSDSVVGERASEKSIKTLTGANGKSTRPLMEAILK